MEQSTRFIGMDVHKTTIAVAVAVAVAVTATGEVGKATAYGTVPNTTAALEKLVLRLRQAGSGEPSVSPGFLQPQNPSQTPPESEQISRRFQQ